ncbi:hypothetical protein B0H19DRAFT_1242800 [Mycena capillaripes]|nr:hypothetical protein B0H19DRAFT_1242800 [Mycena capillaripes]
MAADDTHSYAPEDSSNQKSTATKLRFHLSAIDERMAALETQMAILRQERAAVLGDLAAVVYPILTLANEITSEIFLQYVGKPVDQNNHGPRNSPMRLASVCRAWRAVALSTCGLWTHLSSGSRFTSRQDPTDDKRPVAANFLQLFLRRAGALPLDLHVKLPASPPPESDAIFRALAQFSSQWGNLELNSNGPISFPADIRGPFSALTRLSLWVHPYSDGSTTIPNLLDAPRLRELNLNAVSVVGWKTCIPWSQLTKLELAFQYLNECVEMLARTPNLEVLILSSETTLPLPHPSIFPSINLPRLHTIHLGSECSPDILGYLTLPALNHLHLDWLTIECVDQVQSVVTRSACLPRALDFYLHDADFQPIHDCLTALPAVRKLRMACPGATSDAFTSLFSFIGQHTAVLPALESIHIDDCRADIQLAPLVELLAARTTPADGVAVLKSFSLNFGHDSENEHAVDVRRREREMDGALQKLHDLRSEGLKVDFQSSLNWFGDSIGTQMINKS